MTLLDEAIKNLDPAAAKVAVIVARCTRDGVTSWQHVAAQLGCSVDQARQRYDKQYLPARPWTNPCEPVTPEGEAIDENDVHSLAPKGPGMAVEIMAALKRHGPLTVAELSARVGSPANSVRMRLSRMCCRGWVQNDSRGRGNGMREWLWRLTQEGREVAVTGCAGSIRERA